MCWEDMQTTDNSSWSILKLPHWKCLKTLAILFLYLCSTLQYMMYILCGRWWKVLEMITVLLITAQNKQKHSKTIYYHTWNDSFLPGFLWKQETLYYFEFFSCQNALFNLKQFSYKVSYQKNHLNFTITSSVNDTFVDIFKISRMGMKTIPMLTL